MIGRLYGLTRRQARQRAGELTEQLGLDGAAGRLVRTYSGGMRRRLDVAASLLAAPPVLFLDEPTTGLDPRGRLALWQVLSDLTAQGTSVLLTTQYIEEAERLAGTVVIIDHGQVIASGTPGQLEARAGGDRLDLQSPPGQDPRQLAAALAALGTGEPAIDEEAGRVVLPVADGPGILPARGRPARRRWLAGQRAGPAQAHPGRGIPGLHRPAARPDAARGRRLARCRSPASSHHAEPAMTTAAGTAVPPGRHAATVASIAIITGRNLRRLLRVPTLLVFATVQPVLFVLLFTYAFGGAVHVPGVTRYIDYLLPGIFVLAIGFGASQTGVAIAEDLTTGMIDRFRSLPITAAAVLAGRVAADALRNLFVVGLMIAAGAAIGFRFHAGPAAALAVVALAVAAGLAFSWLNLLLGLAVQRSRIRRAGRPVPGHHLVLHQLRPGAGGDHARLAAGLRQGQPHHRHHRCAAGPVPRRPDDPASHRGHRLDRRAPGRHRPGRYHRLPSCHQHLTTRQVPRLWRESHGCCRDQRGRGRAGGRRDPGRAVAG